MLYFYFHLCQVLAQNESQFVHNVAFKAFWRELPSKFVNLELWQAMGLFVLDQDLIIKEFFNNYKSDSNDDFIGISHKIESSDSDSEARSSSEAQSVDLDLELEVEDDDVWTEIQFPKGNIDRH